MAIASNTAPKRPAIKTPRCQFVRSIISPCRALSAGMGRASGRDGSAIASPSICRLSPETPQPRFGSVRSWELGIRRASDAPNPLRRAPARGEHTDEILAEVCGYDAGRIERLHASGALG